MDGWKRKKTFFSSKKPAKKAKMASKSTVRSRAPVVYRPFRLLPQSGPGTSLSATLIYSSEFGLNPGIGSAATYIFAASGLFDVDITGVGHQPTNFDQLMAMYEWYCVTDCSYKINFSNTDGAANQIVGVGVSDDQTTNIDYRVYIENGNS